MQRLEALLAGDEVFLVIALEDQQVGRCGAPVGLGQHHAGIGRLGVETRHQLGQRGRLALGQGVEQLELDRGGQGCGG